MMGIESNPVRDNQLIDSQISRFHYRLSDLFFVTLVIATCAMTFHIAGKDIAIWAIKIGSIFGGSIAYMASSFRSGLLIACYALIGAMLFSISAAVYLAYDPVPLDTMEKTPIDYLTLMLSGFFGSVFGGSLSAYLLGEIRWKYELK